MHINNKYEYKKLERIDSPNGRKYKINDTVSLPSVTTILSKTADMTHLDEWAAAVGHDEAERIRNESSKLGTGIHQCLEDYIHGKPVIGQFMATTLAKVIIKNGLANVSEVWGVESALYYGGLYAGTCDLIGIHKNTPCIIDFKNSRSVKKIEWVDSYRAQIAAYTLAHNDMYGTNIAKGVIMIANRNATYTEFTFEGTEFDKCVTLWLTSLEKYYNLPVNQQ